MPAYLALLLAVLSRILPHAFHAVSWNFTAVGGALLFFGSQLGADKTHAPQTSARGLTWSTAARLVSAVAVLMATDYYLTVYAYQYPFHVAGYVVTWLWYAAVCLLGMGLLIKPSVLRVIAGVLASSTSFFLLSNLAVWAGSAMYPHTLAGLEACYIAAIPFYRNDLVSTAITAGALFGLPVLAAKIVDALHTASSNDLPLA
jgi:hypothetical protein